MAFRYDGVAWDGQKWVAAPAIVTFGKQIEVIRPGTFSSDGTVASQGHDANSPDSDHTVWPKSGDGIVYAIDVSEAGGLSIDWVGEVLRKSRDSRLKYFIHHKQMFASYSNSKGPAWEWRSYSGYNAHLYHGHLSIHHTASLANSTKLWAIGNTPITQEEEMEEYIKSVQRNLNASGFRDYEGKVLKVDGVPGKRTESAELKRDQAAAKSSTPGAPGKDGAPGKQGVPGKDGKDVTLTIKGNVTLP